MEQSADPEITEFRSLIASIRAESDSLKNMFLSHEEEDEENKILKDFDDAIQTQVYGTLEHLMSYQMNGWRELVDGGNDSGGGTGSAQK